MPNDPWERLENCLARGCLAGGVCGRRSPRPTWDEWRALLIAPEFACPDSRLWTLDSGLSTPDSRLPKLAVCVAYFNPAGYRTRRENFARFAASASAQGADLWCIEAAEGDRWEVAGIDPGRLARVPVRPIHSSPGALWQKERLLNLLIDWLPADYEAVAWIDGDILFENARWIDDTRRVLAEFPVCQLWQQAAWLSPEGVADRHIESAASARDGGRSLLRRGHPGFAWAARRETVRDLAGLYDLHIFGGGDSVMALGFWGHARHRYLDQFGGPFRTACEEWIGRAARVVRGRVGCVPGRIRHLWHGEWKDRRYDDRNKIAALNHFDPGLHLQRSPAGLWEWTEAAPPLLRTMVLEYFHERREDG